jgi:uncharacterized protein (TIGR02646 family)
LERNSIEVTQTYKERRTANPSYRFQWPKCEGQSLYAVIREALAFMTDSRCAYCDGYPIDDTGEEQVDHFRPKTRPEFYHLVCAWENLFLTCSACNKAKLHQWDDKLLRPDEQGFDFSRYFTYRTDSGDLVPNNAASPEDQNRAKTTISMLNLNRAGACIARRNMVRSLLAPSPVEEIESFGYRFLIPMCQP